jgi:hypothetical protein
VINKLKAIGLGLILAAGLVVAVQAPVQAKSLGDCPWGIACLWVNTNGGGARIDFPWSTYYNGGACNVLPLNWRNVASSAANTMGSGYKFTLYDGANCTTPFLQIIPPTTVNFGLVDNDRAESFKIFL